MTVLPQIILKFPGLPQPVYALTMSSCSGMQKKRGVKVENRYLYKQHYKVKG